MAVTQPTVAANGFLNFLEFTTIYLNLLEFTVFEKRLMDGRTHRPTEKKLSPSLWTHLCSNKLV